MTPPASRRETPCDDCAKVRLEKELDAAEAARAFDREAEKAEWAAEYELRKAFHQAVVDTSKASLDRSRDSAKYVQTAAAAIGALYTGALGLVFSVTDHPLPIRGVWAMVFLGLAVALATAYLAFLTKPETLPMRARGSLADRQLIRTAWYTRWVNAAVLDRRWAIRASVLALAFGVAFVPAPFVASARRPDVPAAPVAPAIPEQVADPVRPDAQRLFAAQVDAYVDAVKARSLAVDEARKTPGHDADVNRWFAWAAAVAALLTFAGPEIWGSVREREEGTGIMDIVGLSFLKKLWPG